jgi:hypothetical protein
LLIASVQAASVWPQAAGDERLRKADGQTWLIDDAFVQVDADTDQSVDFQPAASFRAEYGRPMLYCCNITNNMPTIAGA